MRSAVAGAREDIERIIGLPDPASPTASTSDPDTYWTTTNVREAVPGAQTPLNMSIWSRPTERASRVSAYRVGAFSRSERHSPELERDRFIRGFDGRIALDIAYMARVGDRMPGTTGPEIIEHVFRPPPADFVFEPTRRRYPFVAVRLPLTFAAIPGRLRRLAADHERWWRASIERVDGLGHEQLVAMLVDAVEHFDHAMELQVTGIVSIMQPVCGALCQTIERAGAGDLSTLSGASGGAEMAVIRDIWEASRGRIEIAEVTR